MNNIDRIEGLIGFDKIPDEWIVELCKEVRALREDLHAAKLLAHANGEMFRAERCEVAAWRERFPEYKYRPQDDCVALVMT